MEIYNFSFTVQLSWLVWESTRLCFAFAALEFELRANHTIPMRPCTNNYLIMLNFPTLNRTKLNSDWQKSDQMR